MAPSHLLLVLLVTFMNVNSQQFINCKSTAQCRRSYLVCKDNEDCQVDCSGSISCQSSIIMCPTNGKCNINCSNDESCNNAQIRAEDADSLNLQCDDYPDSCLGLAIYCPYDQPNAVKTCHISGDNDFLGVNIFAINGFHDIEFNIQSSLLSTIIHCDDINTPNINFDYSCPISSTSNPPYTQCINDTVTCNPSTVSPTISPSIEPTVTPTSSPTAKLITLTPTNNPTTNPTSTPSHQPSISPTIDPSISPTMEPTYIPTTSPTDAPTDFPTMAPSHSDDVITSTNLSNGNNRNDTNVIIIKTIKNNGDSNVDHTQSITMNLTNLMYVIVGTVLVCCFICAICLLFNVLSARFKFKDGKLHKWSLSSHFKSRNVINIDSKSNTVDNDPYNLRDTASSFKLRKNSNSSSMNSDTPVHESIQPQYPQLPTTTNHHEMHIYTTPNSMMAQPRSNPHENTYPALPKETNTNTNTTGIASERDGYDYHSDAHTHTTGYGQYHRNPNPLLPGIKEEDCNDAFSRSFTMPDLNGIHDPNCNDNFEDGITITMDDESHEITANIKCDSGDTRDTQMTSTNTKLKNRAYWIDNRAPKGKERMVPMFSDRASETRLSPRQTEEEINQEFGLRLANSVNINNLLSDEIINDLNMENAMHYE